MLAITIAFHIAIFLLCSKYVPEWFLSIYYSGKLLFKQLKKDRIAEIIYDIKHRGKREQYSWVRQLFKNEGMDLYLIKKNEIDSRLIQFLKENNHKYTTKAIKNRLFRQQEKITEGLLENMLQILANSNFLLSEQIEQKMYYFI